MQELFDRRLQTARRIKALQESLTGAEKLAEGKACVYATGSFGRCEASPHSDLDLFIVSKNAEKGSQLKRLDEICIKADLIEVTRDHGIQEFSGDGRYLAHYSLHQLTKTLGKPEDDATNTFTARLLLLLESRPLFGEVVYHEVTEDVIAAYWRDYKDHKSDFMPAFLANDILRLWRTFCVNYEALTEREPDREKAKGKLKNYKLKHSRLLTCFSALLYLLARYGREKTVSPNTALEMIHLTPTERLEWLINQSDLQAAHGTLNELLSQYNKFLESTNAPEDELIDRFLSKESNKEYKNNAYLFGNSMYNALNSIGNNNAFHRVLVV